MKNIKKLIGALLLCSAVNGQSQTDQLIVDTITGVTSNAVSASWRDARGPEFPDGGAFGVSIVTNTPFVLTRVEALVTLDDTNLLSNTSVEFVVFRGTNKFRYAMYLDPEFTASFGLDDTNMQLVAVDGQKWKLSLTLPPYAWGTERTFSIRTTPTSDAPFTKLNLVGTTSSAAGIKAYSAGTNGILSQAGTPAIKVWRKMIEPRAQVTLTRQFLDADIDIAPGYALGSATDLAGPWNWEPDSTQFGKITIDLSEGNGFFSLKPDDTE